MEESFILAQRENLVHGYEGGHEAGAQGSWSHHIHSEKPRHE